MLKLNDVFIAIFVMSLIIFFTRVLPFIIFSKRKPPDYIVFIEKYIPPMIMVLLVIYSFADITFLKSPFGIPEIIAALFVVLVHLKFNNSLISIFGGTILYMVMLYFI